MTLLEWLRKSNKDGEIIKGIIDKHKHNLCALACRAFEAAGQEMNPRQMREMLNAKYKDMKLRNDALSFTSCVRATLDEAGATIPQDIKEVIQFANDYKCIGEKVIAAETVSMLNDKYFGQWLALNHPFRDLDALQIPAIEEKVPNRYRHFATALHHRPDHWNFADAIKSEMELEAHADDYIETVLHKVRAHTTFVERYLSGDLAPEDEVDSSSSSDNDGTRVTPRVKLSREQKKLGKAIDKRVELSIRARDADNDEDYEAIIDKANTRQPIIAALGPPGTGKTKVINDKINYWKRKGARILFALPTGNLAARMRAEHPDIDVDTCHGAFLFHRDVSEALPILSQYDLVVVDEVSMLSEGNFDHLAAMYSAASKLPCLVLIGDLWQMPGPHNPPSKVTDSAAWRWVQIHEFYTIYRCKDPKLAAKLATLRTSIPSKKVFRKICDREHRAWTTKLPTAWDILEVMRRTENTTTIATCTKYAAALVNKLSVEVLFDNVKKKPLGKVPFDWDVNPENFHDDGKPCPPGSSIKTKGGTHGAQQQQ